MASMLTKKNIRKIKINPKEEEIERFGSLLFSPKYFEKIIKPAINFFHIKDFKKMVCYSSESGDHYLFTLIFPRTKIIDASTQNQFTKNMKERLASSGFYGEKSLTNKFMRETYSKRKASELPLVWKSTTLGGCWCLNFERYA